MRTITRDFTTFVSSGAGVAWTNPSDAISSNDTYANASLGSGTETTQLLVCTGADFAAIEPQSAIIAVSAIIEASEAGTDPIAIDEVFAWDGATTQGDDQAAAVVVTALDVDYFLGIKDWNWWTLARIKSVSNGIAVRFINTTPTIGAGVAQIDYVRLRVRYIDPSGPGYAAASHFKLVKPALLGGL